MKTASSKLAHFVGIGGIGVSALAQWYLAQGRRVSGSDLTQSPVTDFLKSAGARIKIGAHKASNVPQGTEIVIHSPAVKPNNPELKEASRQSIPVVSHSEKLGEITQDRNLLAVAGTHGKGTTSIMLALAMIKGGLDPTVIVGTLIPQFGGRNFRAGRSKYFILEADEYASSFLFYSPAAAIITNIDKEHLDYYKTFPAIKNAFLKFIANIKRGGVLVINTGDAGVKSIVPKIKTLCQKNKITLLPCSTRSPKTEKIKNALQVPGRHNLSNALAAFTLARHLGIPEPKILKGLHAYAGAWRRLGLRKRSGRELVYDDYAHHPTEVRATLQALREKHPKAFIVCVFQPHQAKRLKSLFKPFSGCFDEADVLILLPTYQVAGRDAIDKRYTAETLAQAVARRGKGQVYFLENPKKDLRKAILEISGDNPKREMVIVMMGAGNIYKLKL